MNKQETYELLSSYHPEDISMLFQRLGIDPKAEEFPEDIIEQVEAVFNSVQGGVDATHALPSAKTETSALSIKQVTAIAQQRLTELEISIPQEALFEIAHSLIFKSVRQANEISNLADAAMAQTLQSRQIQRSDRIIQAIERQAQETQEFFTSDAMQKIINAALPPVEAPTLEMRLAKIKEEEQLHKLNLKQQEKQLQQVERKPKIDLDAFFKEAEDLDRIAEEAVKNNPDITEREFLALFKK